MAKGALEVIVAVVVTACGGGKNSGEPEDSTTEMDVIEDVAVEDVGEEPDAGEDVTDVLEDADAMDGEWVNPGCDAEINVVEDNFRIALVVDLSDYEDRDYRIVERAIVTAPAAGNAITLFGDGFDMEWASVPFDYDGEMATFCTGEFEAGEDVVIDAQFVSHEASIAMGLRRWRNDDGSFLVVGPSQEPYYAPYWILVPQSTHAIDTTYDDSPAVESVDLTVITPDDTWTVLGPGGPGVQEDLSWSFSMDVVQPIYNISFAASPHYEVFDVGTTASGVQVIGAVHPSRREAAEGCFPAAMTTIEWMEENIGPWEWGDYLTLVDVPDFGGAMEHTTVMWFSSDTIEDTPDGDNIVVHETVHHWWGNSVRFSDWTHFWVAEGFDEWSTNFNVMEGLLTEEQFHDLKVFYREYAAEVSYPYMAAWPDPGPLRFDDEADVMLQWMMNMSLFYVYGAAFLEMVNQRLIRDFGTDLNTLLADWYDAYRLSFATTEDFLAFLETETSDTTYWQPLFDDWVYVTPAPTLQAAGFDYSAGEASFAVNRVDGANQDMPDIDVIFVSGEDEYATTIDLPSGTDTDIATVTMPATPERIIIDPDVFYIFRLETAGGWTGPEVGFD